MGNAILFRYGIMRSTKTIIAAIALLAGIALRAPAELPARLTDSDFWKLVSDYSEAGGTFHSENLVSNEFRFQTVIPRLAQVAKPGRAYLGVGSEQNFSYIAATRPAIAFIVDNPARKEASRCPAGYSPTAPLSA
jgi:hypothetical protein